MEETPSFSFFSYTCVFSIMASDNLVLDFLLLAFHSFLLVYSNHVPVVTETATSLALSYHPLLVLGSMLNKMWVYYHVGFPALPDGKRD